MEQLQQLKDSLSNNPWFYDVRLDTFNRTVVYVHYMNQEVFHSIRMITDSACIHYASYAQCTKEKYVDNLSGELDVDHLSSEIDYLQSICKADLLKDIFYEIHDGDDAVTNFSSTSPEVRDMLQSLYNTYGYDLLYEKLER